MAVYLWLPGITGTGISAINARHLSGAFLTEFLMRIRRVRTLLCFSIKFVVYFIAVVL